MGFTIRFNQWLVERLNTFLEYLPSQLVVSLALGLSILLLCVTGRLVSFNRPDWLHWNTTIKLSGRIIGAMSQAILLAAASLLSFVVIAAYQIRAFDQLTRILKSHLEWGAIGIGFGLLIGLALRWFYIPHLEKEEGLSFVDRDLAQQSTKKGFDPRPFFSKSKDDGVFIGIDQKNMPVRLPWAVFNSTHIPVVGATGSGKGVALQTLVSQAHRAGQTIIVIDNKPCEILPIVIAIEAQRTNRAMHYIDSRIPVPAVNPLANLNPLQMTDLLIEILELKKTGEPKSDHYKDQAQRSVRRLVDIVEKQGGLWTFRDLFALAFSSPDVAESENLLSGLERFSRFEQFNTVNGLDLQTAIAAGDVIYFAGDGSSEDMAAIQRTVLSRVMQILANRDSESRTVCLVIDELADLLNGTVLALAAKIRSKNTHIIMAFQSPGNLRQARGVDPDVAFSACWGNTTVKLVYRLEEFQYAEEIAKRIGPQPTQIKTVTRDNATNTTRDSWTQGNRLKIEPHEITNLPMPAMGSGQASMGFLVGAGQAKSISLGPVPINLKAPLPPVYCAIKAVQKVVPEEKI